MLGLDLACFELAHVEHIVDELEQEVRSREDIGKAVLHTRGIGDIFFGDLRHAADTVDGRADIVAHAAQKVRFGGVGQRGLLRRFSDGIDAPDPAGSSKTFFFIVVDAGVDLFDSVKI